MGNDFGAWGEWDHDRPLAWDGLDHPNHGGLRRLVSDLNRLHRELPPLHEEDCSPGGFEWIDFHDAEQSVVSFLRRGRDRDDAVACVFNFTPVPRHGYRVGLPSGGTWREILNTDGTPYWGSGTGNGGAVEAGPHPWNGRPFSASLTLPPLGALYLRQGR
jgi:1,4-alpha-glucan branching enzyme